MVEMIDAELDRLVATLQTTPPAAAGVYPRSPKFSLTIITGGYIFQITDNIGNPSMSTSLSHLQRIAELREKGRTGTMTLDDCKEAIAFLRQERLAMPVAASKSRAKTPAPSGADLLAELGL